MTFPKFDSVTTKAKHKGGTKFYEVTRLFNDYTHSSLVIFRWGKVGAIGEIKVERYTTSVEGDRAFDKKVKEKTNGGYRFEAHVQEIVTSQEQLIRAIGRMIWPKLGKSNLAFLSSEIDVTGMREDDVALRDEDGNQVVSNAQEERRREAAKILDASLAETKLTEAKALQDELQNIPNFGRF